MDEDHADLEGPPAEGRLLQQRHDGHDAVVTAQIMVEPELVDPDAPVLFEKQNALPAAPGNTRGPRQCPQIIDTKDDRRPLR
ncbi:hypothetical protein G3I70_00850 [Actinomadura bangladeshensis]|uniref:Uncharacterized protein n=1 Tax=Actinomadura bangladeshensis TaxID=453573 RepID=A0A6L9Q6R9_9ACTN|nr:hypothetical protein [Actinomadura bangladeshensis]NEA21051.1 hypothetical protein [Actinomadura bangladeshensis]